MTIRYFLSVIWGCFAFCAFVNHPDTKTGGVTIAISPRFSGNSVELGSQLYRSANGDSLYFDAVRFYISSLELQRKGKTIWMEKDSYHLVDAEVIGSQTIALRNVPVGEYDGVGFNVGTDSLANVSGAMGGDLDPTLGMYWAWNSGYVNVKLEGRSNSCKTLHHGFEFHIGGYMSPNQTMRRIELPLKNFKVTENGNAPIQLNADLAQFFNHIHLEKTNEVMIPCRLAAQLADYFKEIFSVP